jgi:Ni/Co efflux regulator RcnB
MKKFGLMIAALVVVAAPSIASAQSVVIERGHQQGYGGHEQGHGARAQLHGDRGYRGHRTHGDKVVIIKKKRHHQGH